MSKTTQAAPAAQPEPDQPNNVPASQTPGAKQFALKPIEVQMLQVFRDQYFTTLSNFLSFIALERLAYTVTPNTKFEISEQNVLFISEGEQPAAPEAQAVSTAADKTKEALGGDNAASVA